LVDDFTALLLGHAGRAQRGGCCHGGQTLISQTYWWWNFIYICISIQPTADPKRNFFSVFYAFGAISLQVPWQANDNFNCIIGIYELQDAVNIALIAVLEPGFPVHGLHWGGKRGFPIGHCHTNAHRADIEREPAALPRVINSGAIWFHFCHGRTPTGTRACP